MDADIRATGRADDSLSPRQGAAVAAIITCPPDRVRALQAESLPFFQC